MPYRNGVFEKGFRWLQFQVINASTAISSETQNRILMCFPFYLNGIYIFSETIDWYNIMLNALPPDDYLSDLAVRYYEGCLGKKIRRNTGGGQEVLTLLTEAIRIAPSSCPILMDCHMLRAEVLIQSGNHEVSVEHLSRSFIILLHPSICIHLQRALTDLNVCKHLSGPKFPTNIPLLINMANCYIQTSNRGDAEHTIELLRSYRRKFNCTKKSKSEWPTLQNV